MNKKIKIFYIKRNIISCLLNFIIKRKQIYITDGNKEIYFGYFISPKKYKEIFSIFKLNSGDRKNIIKFVKDNALYLFVILVIVISNLLFNYKLF